ncbi:MAG: putative DNA-binding domain-containing protein [Myxococcota bacterium]|nr:putative DNA-binding domain-containing protein [Myxococcota bacterium]
MTPELERFFASMDRFFADPAAQALTDAKVEGVAVYGRFVEGHITSVLKKVYPLSVRLLGEDFAPLAASYYRTRPARHFELNRAAEGFVDFLEQAEPDRHPQHLVPLARFEWTDFAVYASEAQPISSLPTFGVNPTLTVLQHPFRLCAWLATTAEHRPPEPARADELALLWRDANTLRTTFVAADPARLLALKLAVEGLSVEAAAAASGAQVQVIQAALDQAIAEGFLLGP